MILAVLGKIFLCLVTAALAWYLAMKMFSDGNWEAGNMSGIAFILAPCIALVCILAVWFLVPI